MMRSALICIAFALASVGSARAQASTVDVVAEDPQIATAVAQWLTHHGYRRSATTLDTQRAATIRDCIVIEEPRCMQAVVDDHATSDVVVYIAIDQPPAFAISMYWITKRGRASSRNGTCTDCTPPMVRDQVLQHLAALAGTSAGPPARAAGVAAPATTTTAAVTSTKHNTGRLAIGLELGEPVSATAGWFDGKLAVVGGVGTGTFGGAGLSVRAAVQLVVARLAPAMPIRVGLGGRLYHHGYDLASIDELPDTHYGVFASVGAALQRGPLELYGEVAPGIDVKRTRSCALASGSSTICPHAQAAPAFVHFVVGARWFL